MTKRLFQHASVADQGEENAVHSGSRIWWRPPGNDAVYTLVPSADGTTTFHVAPFDQLSGCSEMTWRGHAVRTNIPERGTVPELSTFEGKSTSQQEHRENVHSALQQIESGALAKVVVSRTHVVSHPLPPEIAFQRLCEMHPRALVYLMHHPVEGTWCGATPELLLRSQQTDVDTVSLAGTRRPEKGSNWTSKEIDEQQFVTTHIVKTLNDMGAEDLIQDGPRDKSYGELTHLETRISARFQGNLHTLAKSLHPTPAVCGHPQGISAEFIRKTEAHNRMYYAGFLGWSSPLGCAYYVNLRCARWVNNGAMLFAGGGIVSGSVAEDEWLETEAKLQSFAPAFQP